jgi:hypothetical protein
MALLIASVSACGDGRSAPASERRSDLGPTRRPSDVSQATPVPTVALRDIVASRMFVGRRVRVSGRCLPALGEHPLGPMPRTDEWQLEWQGLAVYVVGRRPLHCTESGMDAATVTITALVAEDTLPAIGDLPPAPRRYLVLAVQSD